MRRLSRPLGVLFALGLTGVFLGLAGAGVAYLALAPRLPAVESLRDVEFQEPLRVLAADGRLIAEFGEKKRIPVAYEDLPPALLDAVIAAEDERFFQHPGVDYQGLLRAIWYLVRTGEKGPGGSTITMQVARNFFLSSERTYLRKAIEILVALKIERELSKQEILSLYLNKIYLGNRAYGVGAAAETYYGKPLAELDLAQIAMIAGLPKAPSAFNPIANPERAETRRRYVLGRMLEVGSITAEAYRQAVDAPLTAALHSSEAEVRAAYVAEMVRARMLERYGEEAYTEGYTVHTTVDPQRQAAAVAALREALHAYDERHGYRGPVNHFELPEALDPEPWLRRLEAIDPPGDLTPALVLETGADGAQLLTAGEPQGLSLPFAAMEWARPFISRDAQGEAPEAPADVLARGDVVLLRDTPDGPRLAQVPEVQGALVALDPVDGRLVSLVGGYDFYESKFNRATQAQRQPGSAFKPFIYSAALENGFTAATLVNDAPVVFEDAALESTWRPENYSGRFFGPTRLRQALIRSRNLVSIRVLRRMGVAAAVEHLERFGFPAAELPRNLSLALGSASITPLQLARGYAVFANGGFRVEPWFIQRIVGDGGEVLLEARPARACPEGCPQPEPVAAQEPDATDTTAAAQADAPAEAPRTLPGTNAYLMSTMLRDVIRHGTGRRALALGRSDLAGKTGTTNDQRDAWFSGFNHAIVTSVWVGFDDLQPLGRYETGAKAALPAWISFMGAALEGVPEQPLPRPGGLVTVRVDRETGRAASADNPRAMFETFRVGNAPEASGLSRNDSPPPEQGGASAPPPEQALF